MRTRSNASARIVAFATATVLLAGILLVGLAIAGSGGGPGGGGCWSTGHELIRALDPRC